jgi:hypothetical protein
VVENGIADLVGHLVRMAHGYGFAGEEITIHGKALGWSRDKLNPVVF